mgnify:CR=1 FL=1
MDEEHQTNLGDFSSNSEVNMFLEGDINSGETPPREINMPSVQKTEFTEKNTDYMYHDLGLLYPNPPIPSESEGVVLRRAKLTSTSGIKEILNWVSENSAVVVNLEQIITKESELNETISSFSTFVQEDIGGQILQLTKSKILLLPSECKGVAGIENEIFE